MSEALAAWLLTPIGSYAAAYAKDSFVIPLHGIVDGKCTCGNPECKSPGKHPFTRHGLKDASNEIEKIAALFNYRSDLNIGVITGSISKIFVLDVDPKSKGFESCDSLMTTYGELPPTVHVATGGGGYHFWFNYPKDAIINNRTGFMPGLDVRGQNGYVVAPPSLHISGKKYEFTEKCPSKTADAPQWLIDLIQTKKKEDRQPLATDHSTGAKSEWSIEEVNRMLDVLDPDCPYQPWLEIGMALHQGGFPLSLWDAWSRTGEKFENGDCEKRWHGFNANHGITMGTLVDMAQKNGWKPKPIERPITDTSSVEPLIVKAKEIVKPKIVIAKPSGLFGINALEIDGLIGDTVRWIVRHSMRKQPELALLNTLAFAGAVFGRRYTSPLNTRTNIYTVGIADTGAGKDASRKMIKELAHAAGLDQRIGSDAIRSDSGMLRGLMANASQVMMLDEFGHFLQGLSNEKSPHYIRAQAHVLLKLYSSSNSIYNHGEYADSRATNIIIQYPNLCVYGTSTEENYAKALKKSAIESGELNRFVVIRARTDKEYPQKDMLEYEIDEKVKEGWAAFAAKFGDSLGVLMNTTDIAPEPITVKWGKCGDIQYQIQCRQVDKINEISPLRHLWGRLFENIVKIAMMFAIARNKDAPEFEPKDFDIAQLIVESSIEYLTYLAQSHMSENSQEENNNDIVNAIKMAGGKMGRTDIMRKFRKLKKRDLDDIINGLIEQEVIEAEKSSEDGKGRPKTYYKITEVCT